MPSGLPVRDLLPPTFRRMDDAVERKRKRDPGLKDQRIPGMAIAVAGEKATEEVRRALDIDVFGLIAEAWAKARELHEVAYDEKMTPGRTATLFLGEHELSCDLKPTVEIMFGTLGKVTLEFTLELTAKLKAAQVTIRDRQIVAMGKCEGQVEAVLKYGEIDLHRPLRSREVPLLESSPVDPPLRIP